MTPQILLAALAVLGVLGIGGIALFATGDASTTKAAKRARTLDKPQKGQVKRVDVNDRRRKETQQMLSRLREENKERRRSMVPQDVGAKIAQAGLELPVPTFYALSVALGVAAGVGVFFTGADGITIMGLELRSRIIVIVMAGLAGSIGVPHFILGFLAKRRHDKMTAQFADAIDIIVRGVKSGLPLNECLRIIAAESPAPLGPEFDRLTDNIQMGTALETSLSRFYQRVPLPEVNFFVIVLVIQAKSGGNLAEALGNLSAVIRQRKGMREKISALSSEAKASAWIIGCLPFVVGTMVYFTTPAYIMQLFTTPAGHNILAIAGMLMISGVTVMRNMINLEV